MAVGGSLGQEGAAGSSPVGGLPPAGEILTASGPLVKTGTVLSLPNATEAAAGALSAFDKVTIDKAFDLLNNMDPFRFFTQENQFSGWGLPGIFTTVAIDMTIPNQVINLLPRPNGATPFAGMVAAIISTIPWVISGTGVCTTAPTIQGGNNASLDNVFGIGGPTAAQINAGIAVAPGRMVNFIGTIIPVRVADLGTPIKLKVVQAAAGTGGFALTMCVTTSLMLIPSTYLGL